MKGTFLTGSRWILVSLVLLMVCPFSAATEDPSGEELQGKYLAILEAGVDFFEPIFTEALTEAPNAGFYDIRRYGNWTHPRNEPYHTLCILPANGQVVLTYAVLLRYSGKDAFGAGRYPRTVLFDHLQKAIRWICLTSAYVDHPYPFLPEVRSDLAKGRQWHRRWGLRQDLIGYLSLGVTLMWDDLDGETRSLFRKVATGTALRGRVVRTSDPDGNGNHDQVKQDLSSTIAAAYLFKDHPDHGKFREAVEGAGLDMVSTLKDFGSSTQLEGGAVRDLARSVNMNSDYSSLHHNTPSVWYGVDLIFEGRSYVEIMAALTGNQVPDTYTYKGNGFDGIYEYARILSTDDGVLNHLRAPEYDSSYGAGLLAFCYGGLHLGDASALALERGAADILARHTRAVGQFDYHRGSWSKAAMAFLWRQVGKGNRSYQAIDSDNPSRHGTYYLEGLKALVCRSPEAWAGFVWGTNREAGGGGPGGYVMPARAGGPLIYNTSDSLTGAVLVHRPLWLPASMTLLALLAFLLHFALYRRHRAISETLILIGASSFVSILVIVGVDLFYTLPARVPSAVIPALIFPAVTALASILLVAGNAAMISPRTRVGINAILVALLIVPVSLMIMTRNPVAEMIRGFLVFESIGVFILLHLVILLLAFATGQGSRTARYAGGIMLVLSCLGLWALQGGDPLHLRLVSIRNFPRMTWILALGSTAILLCSVGHVLKTRKPPLPIIPFLLLLAFSLFSVGALSVGRFDAPEIKAMSFEASDIGFSTAGRSQTSHGEIKQAFFTYPGGMSLIFVEVVGGKSGLVTWSGLPVAFYQRDGYVSPRVVASEGRVGAIPKMRSSGNWWRIEGHLGGFFSGVREPIIAGQERVGANWARTERYLDRVQVLSMAPKRWLYQRRGRPLEKISAVIKPNMDDAQIDQTWNSFVVLDDRMKEGWRGACVAGIGGEPLVALANLSTESGSEVISLGQSGWAPVFSLPGSVTADRVRIRVSLNAYGSWRDQTGLLVRVTDDGALKAHRAGPGEYRLNSDSAVPVYARLRWTGPPVESASLHGAQGAVPLAVGELASDAGLEVMLAGDNRLSLRFSASMDSLPPFVHVEEPVLKGNHLEVTVRAGDQSGMASVTLEMDGTPLEMKHQAPFQWRVPVSGPVHTFRALARDGSMKGNQAVSFNRTWLMRPYPMKTAAVAK